MPLQISSAQRKRYDRHARRRRYLAQRYRSSPYAAADKIYDIRVNWFMLWAQHRSTLFGGPARLLGIYLKPSFRVHEVGCGKWCDEDGNFEGREAWLEWKDESD